VNYLLVLESDGPHRKRGGRERNRILYYTKGAHYLEKVLLYSSRTRSGIPTAEDIKRSEVPLGWDLFIIGTSLKKYVIHNRNVTEEK